MRSGFNNLDHTQDAIISVLMVLETKPLENSTIDNLNLETKHREHHHDFCLIKQYKICKCCQIKDT